ncbi:MAG: PIN domain-containing protein [Burkholderiales bacterium]|nr:PIN domain-containing protein [Burkholderiales bacterium]
MSYAIDVNILLYASDAASPMHARASAFLRESVSGREVFCLAWLSLMSYMRMATHPAIFERPLTHDEAARNVESLLGAPLCRVLGEEEGFWHRYREVSSEVPTKGNHVPDAHLAALLRQHGVVTLYTHDRDFRKFSFLRAIDPLA